MMDSLIKFVGIKNFFGIEFIPIQKFDYKRGHIKFWIKGFAIGYPLDDDFFYVIVGALEDLLKTSKYYSELEDKSDDEIFNIMIGKGTTHINYNAAIVHLGESFDDYVIRVIRTKENNIKLLVALGYENNYHEYNLLSVILTEAYLHKVLSEFVEIIKKYCPDIEL